MNLPYIGQDEEKKLFVVVIITPRQTPDYVTENCYYDYHICGFYKNYGKAMIACKNDTYGIVQTDLDVDLNGSWLSNSKIFYPTNHYRMKHRK